MHQDSNTRKGRRLWGALCAALLAASVLVSYWLMTRPDGPAGDTPAPPQPDPARPNMVRIQTDQGTFYIDAYEFPNRPGETPRFKMSFHKARAACKAAGKRLCTDGEWRRACQGAQGKNLFAYGQTYIPRLCNAGSILKSGHSGLVDEAKDITASGAMKKCRTPEGVFDMLGNLEEWVLTSWNKTAGILEGGAWFTVQEYANCSGMYSRQPNYRVSLEVPIFSAGLRCCWSEEAPTEAHLTKEDLKRDTTRRLAQARAISSKKPYNPKDEVEVVPGFWIDRYEYPNIRGEYPLVAVPWARSSELCRAAGKRLCDVAEWEMACGGKQRLRFPYGDHNEPHICGVGLEAPMRSGNNPECRSPGGVMDMSGGVWEWTDTRFDAPAKLYGEDVVLRSVRGGSWFVNSMDSACRPLVGYPTSPQDGVYTDMGFRCCRGELQEEAEEPIPGQLKCPKGLVAIKDFCIQAYEHPNVRGQPPLFDLNYREAERACNSVGLHACSQQEWKLACAGKNRRNWPYGNRYEPKFCHHGTLPNQDAKPVVSGAMPRCKTPEGVYDMCGNLWEWTVDSEGYAVLHGGGSNISAGYGRCDSEARSAPSYSTYETGVRCCANKEEAEALLSGRFVPSAEPLDPTKQANVKTCTTENASCPAGLYCNFMRNLCMLLAKACTRSDQCGDGERCFLPHKRCYDPCDEQRRCPEPYLCEHGPNLCRPPGPTCVGDKDCGHGEICHPRLYYCRKL